VFRILRTTRVTGLGLGLTGRCFFRVFDQWNWLGVMQTTTQEAVIMKFKDLDGDQRAGVAVAGCGMRLATSRLATSKAQSHCPSF